MKKIILFTILASCIVAVAAAVALKVEPSILKSNKEIELSGHLIEKTIPISDFSAITVGSIFNLELTQSDQIGLVAVMDENLFEYFEPSVNNGQLDIKWKLNQISFSNNRNKDMTVTIKISYKQLERLVASGASDVCFMNPYRDFHKLNLKASGSSDIHGDFSGESLTLTCSGSSDYKGNINVQNLKLKLSGSSDATGFSNIGSGEYVISGAADVKGDINCDDLLMTFSGGSGYKGKIICANLATFDLSGATDIQTSGRAENITISASGSSSFIGPELECKHGRVGASGASNVMVSCSETITPTGSGSATITNSKNTVKVLSAKFTGAAHFRTSNE